MRLKKYTILASFILLYLLAYPMNTKSQSLNKKTKTISGQILDDKNEPLPFVNIYIEGTTHGTTSNFDGYFNININEKSSVILAFQYVGYKKDRIKISAGTNPSPISIKLNSEHFQLGEVVISANKEDPAYPIIRNAIQKRKYHRDKVKSYSTKMYMKTVFAINKAPEKKSLILGDIKLGIDYLTESVGTYYFKKPNLQKEVIIAQRVANSKTETTENVAAFVLYNFYNNLVSLGMSARSFISPIASNALFYYKYRLIESFTDNNELIHKIQIIPKRKSDNIFKGFMYIADNKWDIHSLDLTITRQSQIDLVDSVYFKHVYVPINDSVRMPLSMQKNMFLGVLGMKGTANSIGHFSDYKMNIDFPKKFFGNESLIAEQESMEKDSVYWINNRQSLLTDREKKKYHNEDSAIALRATKPYRDSVNKIRNKFKIGKLITDGYSYRDTYIKKYYKFYPLIEAISAYNTVEGFNINTHQRYYKIFENKDRLIFHQYLKYSFTNKNLYFKSDARYYTDWRDRKYLRFEGGKDAVNYNQATQLKPLINTAYTLLLKDNFLKLYQKEYAKLSYGGNIFNGIHFSTSLEYANRSPLVNHSDFTILKQKTNKEFTSNNPQDKLNDDPAFNNHQALIFRAQLVIKFKERYETFPTYKSRLGSLYPILKLSYKKGIKAFGSDIKYDNWNIGIYDILDLKNFGVSNVSIELGGFLNSSQMYFMDYRHFNGNQTIFLPHEEGADSEIDIYEEPKYVSKNRPVSFHALDYYSHSTNTEYFSFNYEHHFNGWIINKFPFLRKSKAQVVAGMSYLNISDKNIKDYTELYVGLEHILKMFRIDLVTKYQKGQKIVPEVRIGLGM